MTIRNLIIGGIQIPLRALTDGFAQDYEEIAGIGRLRLASGTLIPQRAWPASGYKLRTVISAAGRLPAPLDALDRAAAHEISCARFRMVGGQSNILTLPAGRRLDAGYAPQAFALLDGELVATGHTLVGHTAFVAAVSGAQHYQVRYWPRFTGLITHRAGGEPWRAAGSWTLTVEEV